MIDYIIIGIYLGILLLLGIYNRSKYLSLHVYGSISNQMQKGTLLLIATIFANSVGGATVYGLSVKAFNENISYAYAIILTIIIDILIAAYLVPRISKHYGVISVGQIMAKYYGKVGSVITGLAVTFVSFGHIAVQISVSSKILEPVLKINYIEGVILSYLIVTIYTALGGLRSVIFVNLFQFLSMVFFIPILTICALYAIGGVSSAIEIIPKYKYSFADLKNQTGLLFLSFMFFGLNPGFIQRSFISKDTKRTQQAIYIKSAIYLFFILIVSLNGLLCYAYEQKFPSQSTFIELIHKILPFGLYGLVIVGFLSSSTSTADSELNIASMSFINDILKPIFKMQDTKLMLLFIKVSTILIGIFAIYLALEFTDVIELVLFVNGFWISMIVVPFVACLFNIKVGKKQFIFCCLAGLMSFSFWYYYFNDLISLKGVFIGFITNLIFFALLKTYNVWHKVII